MFLALAINIIIVYCSFNVSIKTGNIAIKYVNNQNNDKSNNLQTIHLYANYLQETLLTGKDEKQQLESVLLFQSLF